MDKIFLLTLCFYFCSAKIKINKLDVPSAILYGSQDDVILDCDFDSGGDQVMEIKWFLDGDNQIYQWLPSTNTKARALGRFRDHIDVDYKATDDENTMYRALHITDLQPDFTGNYTCKVSGPLSEDTQTKRMIIYVAPEDPTPNDFDEFSDILELTISEETSEISCSAGGLFPEPNMTVYITNDNETEIEFRQDEETITETEDGYYNVTSVLKYDADNVTQNFYYICELELPGTPYNISEKWMHFQDESSETQVVEEGFFNSTNSTESSFNGSTVLVLYAEIETQIEEESDFVTTTTETATNTDDADVTQEDTKDLKASTSSRHLLGILTTLLPMLLLSPLYL